MRICGGSRFLNWLEQRGESPSVLIVVAHPDDEVVGAGAQLRRLRDPLLLHVTDGAPRNMRDARAYGFSNAPDYAAARRRELEAALALAGIGRERTAVLGYADQQASLHMTDLAREMADALRRHRPEVVLTHSYEGGHPDHDATAFAVHAACRLLGEAAPEIVEASFYHDRDGHLATFSFLGDTGVTLSLTPAERRLKQAMIDCFTTQTETLGYFPVERECFRLSHAYDFTEPPHGGALWYERFDWGMTGPRWRALARDALAALSLDGRL